MISINDHVNFTKGPSQWLDRESREVKPRKNKMQSVKTQSNVTKLYHRAVLPRGSRGPNIAENLLSESYPRV